jgi:cytochrome bd ubiquinol oxidase subunit II
MAMDVHSFLATTCYLLLGVILILYVMTDGFDLGVGILTLFEREEGRRTEMMAVINGAWDANETWLVLFGVALFAAFPVAFSVTLHALYVPVGMMLAALILRGIAFVRRKHARGQRVWKLAFGGGSLVAALAQGYALGGVVGGLPVAHGEFTGSAWSWLSPFSTLVAAGVAAGYAMLGGGYLIVRTRGGLQAASRRRSRHAAWIMFSAASVVTLAMPALYRYVAQRWFTVPDLYLLAPLTVLALVAFVQLMRGLGRGDEHSPFVWSLIIFITSFVGLVVSLYPYLVPPTLSLRDTPSSITALVFMLTGIGVLIPVLLVYNGYQHAVLEGKTRRDPGQAP